MPKKEKKIFDLNLNYLSKSKRGGSGVANVVLNEIKENIRVLEHLLSELKFEGASDSLLKFISKLISFIKKEQRKYEETLKEKEEFEKKQNIEVEQKIVFIRKYLIERIKFVIELVNLTLRDNALEAAIKIQKRMGYLLWHTKI